MTLLEMVHTLILRSVIMEKRINSLNIDSLITINSLLNFTVYAIESGVPLRVGRRCRMNEVFKTNCNTLAFNPCAGGGYLAIRKLSKNPEK